MFFGKPMIQGFLIAIIIFSFSGCSNLGKKNVLFMTKTSMGVDMDTKPPTFDVGFNRKEVIIGPVMEGGKVHSNMASFNSDVGVVNQGIGQSFATGQAATIMTKYLNTPAKPAGLDGTISLDEINDVNELTIPKERERYFFGTDTGFALRVNFALEEGGLPDSINLGYKRKELAFVPLVPAGADGKKAALASLMATDHLDIVEKSRDETELKFNQFFATGNAAKYLAANPGIRDQIAPKIIPAAKHINKTAAVANSAASNSTALDSTPSGSASASAKPASAKPASVKPVSVKPVSAAPSNTAPPGSKSSDTVK
jgi:hypothetical protein